MNEERNRETKEEKRIQLIFFTSQVRECSQHQEVGHDICTELEHYLLHLGAHSTELKTGEEAKSGTRMSSHQLHLLVRVEEIFLGGPELH